MSDSERNDLAPTPMEYAWWDVSPKTEAYVEACVAITEAALDLHREKPTGRFAAYTAKLDALHALLDARRVDLGEEGQ